MTLTPEDIESKRFHDAFRGYNHEEVDLFLDEVAASFKALYLQVETTAQRARELETQLDSGRSSFEDSRRAVDETRRLQDEIRRLQDENRRVVEENRRIGEESRRYAEESARRPAEEPVYTASLVPAPTQGFSTANAESILKRTLLAAQRAADEAVAEAESQAEQIVADARQRASQLDAESSRRAAAVVSGAEDRLRRIAEQARRLRELYTEHHARLRTFVEGQMQSLTVLGPPPDELDAVVPEESRLSPPPPAPPPAPHAAPPPEQSPPEPPPALPSWASVPPPPTTPAAPLSGPSTAEPFWGATLGGAADPAAGHGSEAADDAPRRHTKYRDQQGNAQADHWTDQALGSQPAPPVPDVPPVAPAPAPPVPGTAPYGDPESGPASPWSRPASSFSPHDNLPSNNREELGVSDRAPIFPPGSAPPEDGPNSGPEDENGRRSVRELFWGKG